MCAKALILTNPRARQGDDDLEPVLEVLQNSGIDPITRPLDKIDEIARLIATHRDSIDRIVIGGGDGTLNACIKSVMESGLPLGILPMGTANDLARTLQIPFDMRDAARVVADGLIKHIDIGVVNGTCFFNAASIGLAVKVTRTLNPETKKKWGGLSYPIAFLRAFRENRSFSAEVTCDGRTDIFRSIQITVGNGRHYGRGMAIREDAEIDDHLLHCYSLEPQSFWELLKAAPSIFKGTFGNRDRVSLMEGRKIDILTGRSMAIDIDGELIGRTPAHFSIEPAALPVIVPKET